MNSILPDEPIPHTLNDDLQSLISDFNQLDVEEQKLSQRVADIAEADKYDTFQNGLKNSTTLNKSSESFSSDTDLDPEKARAKRLKRLIENMNDERDKVQLQNRLILCRLLLINQSIQDVKKDLSAAADDDNDQGDLTPLGEPLTPTDSASVIDEYTRNYDVAGAIENSHAYQTLNMDNYQSLLSNFNKTNEFD